MGNKRKLTREQIEALRADYEAWNPFDKDAESVAELAARHGVSKQTLYNYRDRWAAEQNGGKTPSSSDLAATVQYLTGELVAAKTTVNTLRSKLLENGIDPDR